MLKCKETVDLASKQLDTTLPWLKRLELKIHIFICKTCRKYVKQLKFMQHFSKNLDQNFQDISMPEETKKRIKKNLDLGED